MNLLTTLYTLSFSPECLASEIFPEAQPLADVVARSEVIAVVRAAKPAQRDDTLAVPGHPDDPYSMSLSRITVEDVVHGAKAIEVGAVVEVAPGGTGVLYGTHLEYVVNGAMESPIVSVYTSPFESAERPDRWLVFLRRCTLAEKQRWCFTVGGAEERVAKLKTVKGLLADPPLPSGVKRETAPEPPK